jgi:predicted GIY-YIG superfamily endonuclease
MPSPDKQPAAGDEDAANWGRVDKEVTNKRPNLSASYRARGGLVQGRTRMGTWKTTRLDTPKEHPQCAAVYAVWVWNWNVSVDTARLIYIGSTNNFRNRMGQHRTDSTSAVCHMYRNLWKTCDFYVRYSDCSQAQNHRQRERRLIRKLRPFLNQETNRGYGQIHRIRELIGKLQHG